MASGRDFMSSAGKRGATGKKNANCSFCRKSYREVGPLVEGPDEVYICGECIELCQSILDQEQRRRGNTKQLFNKIPSPREIVAHLQGRFEQQEMQIVLEAEAMKIEKLPVGLRNFEDIPAQAPAEGVLN